MIDYKKELNKEQLSVVHKGDGACLVLAGAGSGKTRTITYRVAYLLAQGVAPENILLVTFTNKAAKEMIHRIAMLTSGEIKLPWSGTFHHVAFRVLRRYAPLLGYQNNFTILDSQDSLDLIKLCLKQEGIDRKEKRFPSPKVLQNIMSFARNAQRSIADVLDEKHPNWLGIADTIGRIADDYAKRKREANAMDFDDLLVNLHLLLVKSEKVRKKYATQFQYVLVDEYQDTNKIQASIIRLFASVHKNILVVGDDAQSIYSFRAADIENILTFDAGYSDAKIFRLETNYRSTPDILNLANDIIANNVEQHKKALRSVIDVFTKPEVHAFVDQQEEARFIAERILELRDEGVALDNIAVLFRAAYHSQALEVELTKRDIPYDFRGGVRFFERAHIKDVLAFLRVFHNKDDIVAWSRVLNMQVGIGPASVERLLGGIRSLGSYDDLASVGSVLSARGQTGWNDFLGIWHAMEKTDGSPTELIGAVATSNYAKYLEYEHQDYRERLQDIEQLGIFAARQSDLHRFLAEASMQESYSAAVARGAHDEEEKLVLSTIHQAKGLEWEAVFILNVTSGQFPNDRALREHKGVEEERRLFYVATTRARKYLYITYPLTGFMSSVLQGPSMFIEELNQDLIDLNVIVEEDTTVFIDPSDDVDDVAYVTEEDIWKNRKRSFLSSIEDI